MINQPYGVGTSIKYFQWKGDNPIPAIITHAHKDENDAINLIFFDFSSFGWLNDTLVPYYRNDNPDSPFWRFPME